MTSPQDPEQRIADLEKQLADARRIADLERQLAEARSRQAPGGPGRTADLLSMLQQLRPGVAGSFGNPLGGPPAAPPDTRLAAAPRRIPIRFLLAELLPFRWWYVCALFVIAIPTITLWVTNPGLEIATAVAAVVLIYAYHAWTARNRLAVLRWGRVAQVAGADIVSRATYYSGTTWSNVWLPQAHGWTVSRELWSGPSTKTTVCYALDGYRGEITIRGRAYDDGVILADERNPKRALCVSSFAYDLDRDDTGNWVGRLRPRLMIGMVVWLLVVVGWVIAAAGISTGAVDRLMAEESVIELAPGGSLTVTADGPQQVDCNDGHLTVRGSSDSPVTVRGHCASLVVSGIEGVVTVDSVDVITLDGIGNHVTYHSGRPKVTSGGINNTAVRG